MEAEYETCRSALQALVEWYERDLGEDARNEATTRLQLINRLFFECLGWDEADCKCEERLDGGYADYAFYCPRRSLIVEAKKEGVYFELPAGYSRLEYSLQSLRRDEKEVRSALDQAMCYCQNRGTPLGAVCNGHQLICFVASRADGTPTEEGRALVFTSLRRMAEEFPTLWKYVSKPGLQEKHLERRLHGADVLRLPVKLSASIPSYPGVKGRNTIQTDLKIVGDLVIEDVARVRDIEPQFIRECFCPSGALSQYALVSKSILQHRYAALFGGGAGAPTAVPAMTKKGPARDILADALGKRPILLVGDVGVGKTMFILYLMHVAGSHQMKKAIALYIDLGSAGALSHDLRSFLLKDVERQLLEVYDIDIRESNLVHGVYDSELSRFSRGIHGPLRQADPAAYRAREIDFLANKMGDAEQHLRTSLHHLSAGRRKQIVMFLDNADQRGESIQENAFLAAQEIAASWPVAVFLSIRPQTFHRSRRSGALSGYSPRVFTISPPRVDEVINKRLTFALKIARGEITPKPLPSTISLNLKTLEAYLLVLINSFERNHELMEFIDNLCRGNIRLALDYVTTFIASGHVDTKKILGIEAQARRRPSYVVPLHEFLRAVIYGDNVYYHVQTSSLANIFDIATPDGREHFLVPILIEYINRAASSAGAEGFVDTGAVCEYAQGAGFTPDQIQSALLRALQKNLVEAEGGYPPQGPQDIPRLARATTVGVYHIAKLVRQFTYVDAVIVDTPVLDDDARRAIRDVHSIRDRLSRAEIFCGYLDAQWAELEGTEVRFRWPDVCCDLREDMKRIGADDLRRSRAGAVG